MFLTNDMRGRRDMDSIWYENTNFIWWKYLKVVLLTINCVAWSVMTRRTGQLFILSINWIFAGKLGQRKRTAWKYWMLPPIVKPYCYRLERQLSPRRRVPPRARNPPISTTRHVAGSTSSDCQVINIFGKYFCSPLSKKYFSDCTADC